MRARLLTFSAASFALILVVMTESLTKATGCLRSAVPSAALAAIAANMALATSSMARNLALKKIPWFVERDRPVQ